MSVDVVDSIAMHRFALTSSPPLPLVQEQGAELRFEASPSNQRLCSTKCSIRSSTRVGAGEFMPQLIDEKS